MFGKDSNTLNVHLQVDGQLVQLVWRVSGNRGSPISHYECAEVSKNCFQAIFGSEGNP